MLHMQIHMCLLRFIAFLELLLKMFLLLFQVLVRNPDKVRIQEGRARPPRDASEQAVPTIAGRINPSARYCLFLHMS